MSDGTVDFSDLANKEVSLRDLVDHFRENIDEVRRNHRSLKNWKFQAVAHNADGWDDKEGELQALFFHILQYSKMEGFEEYGKGDTREAIGRLREGVGRDARNGDYGGMTKADSMEVNLVPDLESLRDLNEKFYNDYADRIFIKFIPPRTADQKMDEDTVEEEVAMENDGVLTAETVHADLKKHTNVIVEGVAGSGKSHLLTELRDLYPATPEGEPSLEVVVFHPSTSYEDFVSGLRPTTEGSFQGEAGIFVTMCDRAARHTDQDFLLFIDEINRANTSRVFGDLMLVLEKSKRASRAELEEGDQGALLARPTEKTIALQTPIDDDGDGGGRKKYLQVPENLHVLGTMNTTDRSVGTIDLALRRRFHWVTMEPMSAPVLQAEMRKKSSAHLDSDALRALIEWYDQVNGKLLSEVGPDARLGHSYFFGTGKTIEDIAVDLLNQLKEVITTFSLSPSTIRSVIGDEGVPVGDQWWKIEVQGKGLGARPEIRKQNGSLSDSSASA